MGADPQGARGYSPRCSFRAAARQLHPVGALLDRPSPDLTGAVSTGSERRLLGLALNPESSLNGRFYLNYTDTDGDTRLAATLPSAPTSTWTSAPETAGPVETLKGTAGIARSLPRAAR